MSDASVSIPKEEYDSLRYKAELFDRFVETDEFTRQEIRLIMKAMKGPFISKSEFMKRHPDLA